MVPEQLVWAVGAALFGLSVGSFVNVLIYRLPRDRSVVLPRSHCFCCGTPLTARDLLPVVSFLLAGRRCRYCGVVLSSQYALVEALCGLLFAGLGWQWGMTLPWLIFAVATGPLVAAFAIDLRYKIIPTSLNAAIALAGLGGAALATLAPDLPLAGKVPTLSMALAGGVLGYVVFEAIVRFGRWLFRQEAMGHGDVLLAAAVGTLTGPSRHFGTFFLIGIFTGALVGIGLLLSGRLTQRQAIPFGPFLVLGALAVMLWPQLGDAVARWYGFGG